MPNRKLVEEKPQLNPNNSFPGLSCRVLNHLLVSNNNFNNPSGSQIGSASESHSTHVVIIRLLG
ncbi:hypothetical protein ACS0TY_025987 [Phlomoides rotata]